MLNIIIYEKYSELGTLVDRDVMVSVPLRSRKCHALSPQGFERRIFVSLNKVFDTSKVLSRITKGLVVDRVTA